MPKKHLSPEPDIQSLITNFGAVCASLQKYLKGGKPLSFIQLHALSVDLEAIQTALDAWVKKHGKEKEVH